MQENILLEMIKERFSKYKTYYEILQINPDDATDEKVKKSYENKLKEHSRQNYNSLLKKINKKNEIDYENQL